ncbi:Protein of unknown function [Cotesia congregata]|uniref:Uncharacterized protein n=1 Tax=Cotesia congregata TaxID=51543 RepID=A0A8J2H848_COTCN|nr:Protein of unknown function [Cotesia congregata]
MSGKNRNMSPLEESSPRSSETEIPDNMLPREIRIGGQNKRKRDGSFRKLAGSPIEDQSQNQNDNDDDENDSSNNNNDVAFVLEESGELRDDVRMSGGIGIEETHLALGRPNYADRFLRGNCPGPEGSPVTLGVLTV